MLMLACNIVTAQPAEVPQHQAEAAVYWIDVRTPEEFREGHVEGAHNIEYQDIIAGVHEDGGALIVAHPWSKLKRPLAGVLDQGVDGVEVVNGVIHGGRHVVEAALGDRSAPAMRKALIGSLDYKLGPHVNAVTLIPHAALVPYDASNPDSVPMPRHPVSEIP